MVTLVAGNQLFLEPSLFLACLQYKARYIRRVSFAAAAEPALAGVSEQAVLLPPCSCWNCPASLDLQAALSNVGNTFRSCCWLPKDVSAKRSQESSVLADLLSQVLNAWHTLGKGLEGKCTVH